MKIHAILAALLVFSGCASSPKLQNAPTYDPSAVHTSVLSKLEPKVSGTFYVTYIPALFTEPEDVRIARDRNIALQIILALEKAGLKNVRIEDGDADYEVSYSYRTGPGMFGSGFSQNFEIWLLDNRKKGGYAEKRVWHGSASISAWPDRDITFLFPTFISDLMKQFPIKKEANPERSVSP